MNLEVLEFINNNKNWKEILEKNPYNIKIKEEDNFIILNYSQVESDFSLRIVQECRGLILVKEDNKYIPVCIPFFKFFNYGEKYASKIDWNSAQVQEKIDGSLIKIWFYKDKMHISTNSMIDAFKATIALPTDNFKTYGDLVIYCLNSFYKIEEFNKDYTYMFELVSPYTRIVVPYKEIKLFYLGQRNNKTFNEMNLRNFYNYVPKLYNISILSDCVNNANKLPKDKEGYVVVDERFNRIKVKSPVYVAMHHIRTNVATEKSILELIRKNEIDEFTNYFPEYKNVSQQIKDKYNNACADIANCYLFVEMKVKNLKTRKEQAQLIMQNFKNCSDFAFSYLDGRVKGIEEFIKNLSLEKLLKRLENY